MFACAPQQERELSADSKGRISLGSDFAGVKFIARFHERHSVQLQEVVTIPAYEAWLFKNKKAQASVLRGLEQARKMEFVDPPNLDEDEKLAAMIPD